MNFVSNIVSLITFLFLDIIHFEYGIIMGLSMILGAYFGSKFAVQKGVGYVRTLFFISYYIIDREKCFGIYSYFVDSYACMNLFFLLYFKNLLIFKI
ncbi:hypothetical protein ACT7DJ_15915 [Bacillus cereus]